jgi:hypothetical protein
MTPLNVFVTESNVEIYLSTLHVAWDAASEDNLLRLVAKEKACMGLSREHLENGERRVAQGKELLGKQRAIVARLSPQERSTGREAQMLQTVEKIQALLEEHLKMLKERFAQARL